MRQFIVRFVDSDGYTYSCEQAIPFVAESAECIATGLEQAAQRYIKSKSSESSWFKAFGHSIPIPPLVEHDKYYPPDILTVDEWFAYCRSEGSS